MAQLPALHKACLDGSLEGVRAALAQPDAPQVLQTPDADGRTPLHWAASSDAKHALIEALHAAGFVIAIESNGTIAAHPGIDWVCISPKAGSLVVQRSGDELKLVWPQAGTDVAAIEGWDFRHFLVQPMDDARLAENQAAAIDFVLARPHWRLTLQAHKALGLR